MTQFSNAMAIFKLLPKTNCRECDETTCLAFASKVFLGQKQITRCPYVDQKTVNLFSKDSPSQSSIDEQRAQMLAQFKERIQSCDLKTAAQRTGGIYRDGKLCIRIFGKPFFVDQNGQMTSDIHINPWITSNVLGYILACKGVPLTGKWVPFRELKGGREKNSLFVQRSEASFKRIADTYTGFFEDLILIFKGKQIRQAFDSDISLVLYPLPKVPILICYWKPDEGMGSDLHLFFDLSADDNAGIDIVYGIAAGIVVMFEKIALRHGA